MAAALLAQTQCASLAFCSSILRRAIVHLSPADYNAQKPCKTSAAFVAAASPRIAHENAVCPLQVSSQVCQLPAYSRLVEFRQAFRWRARRWQSALASRAFSPREEYRPRHLQPRLLTVEHPLTYYTIICIACIRVFSLVCSSTKASGKSVSAASAAGSSSVGYISSSIFGWPGRISGQQRCPGRI